MTTIEIEPSHHIRDNDLQLLLYRNRPKVLSQANEERVGQYVTIPALEKVGDMELTSEDVCFKKDSPTALGTDNPLNLRSACTAGMMPNHEAPTLPNRKYDELASPKPKPTAKGLDIL